MKHLLFTMTYLLFSLSILAAEDNNDPSLIFKVTFDGYTVTADKAVGYKKSPNFPASLALRMYKGIAGKGNALTLNSKERVRYSNFKNHNPKKGTISFWVASLNWKPSEKFFQVFYDASLPNYRFLIYKYAQDSILRFYISQNNREEYISIPLKNEDWTPGRWHKIDAVWDETRMALYLDGVLAKPLIYTRNPLIFTKPKVFPETKEGGYMSLGGSSLFRHNPEHSTAFDELEIYDRILTPAEIRSNYEKVIPPSAEKKRNELPAPLGKDVTIDGVLDEQEWQDAACIPIVNPVVGAKPGASGVLYIKHTGENLLIGAELSGGTKSTITGNDLVDIWRDDSFEIHIFTSQKKRYQFIVNANGAMYDATVNRTDGLYDQSKLSPGWNSGARTAVKKKPGKWSLEIAIPRKNIGADGNSVLVNFGCTRYLAYTSHVSWAKNSKTFFDETKFGILHFRGHEKPIRMEKYGLANGVFQLKLNSEAKAEIVAADGKRSPRLTGLTEWQAELPMGIYDFCASAPSFYYASRITVSQPLEIRFTNYASKRRLDVILDCSSAGIDINKAIKSGTAEGYVFFLDPDGKNLCSGKVKFNQPEVKLSLVLPQKIPSPGKYSIKAVIKVNGKEAISASRIFRVPDMTPFHAKVAADHSVPAPWSPVKQLDANRYSVWNRVYTFGNGPFPVQVIADGEKMLAKSPVLQLNGKAIQWSQAKITDRFDDEIHFAGTGHMDGISFEWKSVLCFDGLVKIKISMLPAKNGSRIKKLNLSWSVPQNMARVMLDPLFTPWKNKDGEIYSFPYAHGQDFIIWTVGREKGFLWWIESLANMKNSPGYKQFTISRKGDQVTVNADFITENVILNKKADYSMVFMATPGRPLPKKSRDFNPGQIWDVLKHETLKVQYYSVTEKKPLDYATEPWCSLIPLYPEKFGKHIDKLEAQGTRYMPYSQPMMTTSMEDTYDWFLPEWKQIPGIVTGEGPHYQSGLYYTNEACCGGTGAEDLYVWNADQLMSKFPKLPGLYYDYSEGRLCSNSLHGCGGEDAFGKSYSSSNLLRHRNYFIRIKRVLNKHGKDKVLFLHAHNRFIPFTHGIGDYWFPGEQYSETMIQNLEHFYCENIPLREFQSAYCSPIKGVGIVMMSQYQHTAWSFKMKKRLDTVPNTLSFMTPALLHDMNISNCYVHHKTVERWWCIKHDVKLSEAVFHGYWFSDAVKTNTDKIYASWYEWKTPAIYDRMIVVGNLSRKNKSVKLQLDLKKLGLDGKRLSYYDLWTGTPLQNIDTLEVGSNNFRLIGIKVTR